MKIAVLINSARREADPPDELVQEIEKLLAASGHSCTINVCDSIDKSRQCLDAAKQAKVDAIWIGGGDGTLNNVLNSTVDSEMAYGIIPMGTVNALARSLGLPLDPLEAAKYLIDAQPVPFDIGTVAGRYFFAYATVGIHARLFHNIDEDLKRNWGRVAFWVSGAKTIWNRSRLPKFQLEFTLTPSGHIENDHGYSLVLSNLGNFAGFDVVTNDPPASPGYLRLIYFRQNSIVSVLRWFARLRFLGQTKSAPQYGQLEKQVTRCKAISRRNMSIQIDGEPITPSNRRMLEFESLENKVQILLQPPEAERLTPRPGHLV